MTCDDDGLKPMEASSKVERICTEEASESPDKIHHFVHILEYLAMPPILGPESNTGIYTHLHLTEIPRKPKPASHPHQKRVLDNLTDTHSVQHSDVFRLDSQYLRECQ
jgi:hypothetical protein